MFEQVRALIAEQMHIDANSITEDKRIVEDLGADSLDTVEMLMTLEETFGIAIPDEDAAHLKTVGDIVKYIEANKSK